LTVARIQILTTDGQVGTDPVRDPLDEGVLWDAHPTGYPEDVIMRMDLEVLTTDPIILRNAK